MINFNLTKFSVIYIKFYFKSLKCVEHCLISNSASDFSKNENAFTYSLILEYVFLIVILIFSVVSQLFSSILN